MQIYEFRFLNGVAEIYVLETGQVVLHQPFKPMDASYGATPQPWANRDEAYAWAQANFNHHLQDEIPDEPVTPPPPPKDPGKLGTIFNPDGSINLRLSQRLWNLYEQGIDPVNMTVDEVWSGVMTEEELVEQRRIDAENRAAMNNTSAGAGN